MELSQPTENKVSDELRKWVMDLFRRDGFCRVFSYKDGYLAYAYVPLASGDGLIYVPLDEKGIPMNLDEYLRDRDNLQPLTYEEAWQRFEVGKARSLGQAGLRPL